MMTEARAAQPDPNRAETEALPTYSSAHIVADALACDRGSRTVVSNVAFSLGPSELLILKGPNGSGKSSLLRLLAGLISPSAGRLDLGWDDPKREDSILHYFGHADAIKPGLTLRENLDFWRTLYGKGMLSLADAAHRVGLGHTLDLPGRVLSAGQLRRAGLARLLLSPRPIWLLDEPTSALDQDGESLLGDIMVEHLTAGGLIVAATHAVLPITPTYELNLGSRG